MPSDTTAERIKAVHAAILTTKRKLAKLEQALRILEARQKQKPVQ